MNITPIQKEHKNGCGIACLAMIMRRSYAEVVKDFEADFDRKGLSIDTMVMYLADHGYSVICKKVENCNDVKEFSEWMLTPFAPIHIVEMQPYVDSNLRHVVVMDDAGKLICPDGDDEDFTKTAYVFTRTLGIFPK